MMVFGIQSSNSQVQNNIGTMQYTIERFAKQLYLNSAYLPIDLIKYRR